jgi:hypothetical protein
MAGALQILFISLNLFTNDVLDQLTKPLKEKYAYVEDGSLMTLLELRRGTNRTMAFYFNIIINKFLNGKLSFVDAREILTETNKLYKKLEKDKTLEMIKFDKDLCQKMLADVAYAGQTGWNLSGGKLVNSFEASNITDSFAIETDRLKSAKEVIKVVLDNLQSDFKMLAAYPQEKKLLDEFTSLENRFKSIDIKTYPFFFKRNK